MPSLLPPDDDLTLLHTRDYEVKVYRLADDELLVRGALSDRKPPGLYVADDPEPLEIHQMHVELLVSYPSLTITSAQVVFPTHPHESCPSISAHYEKLVGLSVARGFTHKIRELFGGPRGCTHTTALLQAMAPAIVQSTWSMALAAAPKGEMAVTPDPDVRMRRAEANINTCHIWAEEGDHVASLRAGGPWVPPIPMVERMVELGRKPDFPAS